MYCADELRHTIPARLDTTDVARAAGIEAILEGEQRTMITKLLIITALVLGVTVGANAAFYQITVENVSPNVVAPVVFISHNGSFDFFAEGYPASHAVEVMAETGNTAGVAAMAQMAMPDVGDVAVTPDGPMHPGESRSVVLRIDAGHSWLSFGAMIGVSNDAFIGASMGEGAISMRDPGLIKHMKITVSDMDVWDAGTEVNDELATSVGALGAGPEDGMPEDGVITKPHPGILGVGDIPVAFDWLGGDVAKITIQKVTGKQK